jgi:hypothetical protein
MLCVIRDPNEPPERRDEMAKAAAPYVHPKLAATELQHGSTDENPLKLLLFWLWGGGVLED